MRTKKRKWPQRLLAWARRDVVLVLLDLAVVIMSFMFALVLRFEGEVPEGYWNAFWIFVPGAALAYAYINFSFGLYGQMWRYASIREARRLLLAGLVVTGFVLASSELLGGQDPRLPFSHDLGERVLPLSVAVLGGVMSLLGFGAIRFQSRLFGFQRRIAAESQKRVLLFGAGDAGAMVARDILRHPELGLKPVGFVDDDRRKIGRTLHGIKVIGPRTAIPQLVEGRHINQVLMTIPSATSELVREVAEVCERAAVPLRVLPSVKEIVGGRVSARDIRDLRIEDLLGRQMVQTDLQAVREILRGRRVLVTGAGGSIGSEIVRQVAAFGPSELLALDHDEIHLHELVTDVDGGVRPVLADVRDAWRIDDLFEELRPQVVFHAAAHKHLPLLEHHAGEGLRTNVLGTANLARAAVRAGVERFVLISTDKAVRPTSVMGASKWFAEQVVRSHDGRGCIFSAVRFGNVVGSRGGVIQTFLRQIEHGGPVTVTDAGMARYFMSIEEAVQLVLQAAALAEGGEVFTLEMGEPMKIMDLARRVIRLAGQVPERDVPITMVGP
ncbi:MAG TPA: nucleoside-diphosphate sugar epimerase/dehydratase, partial [Actinomycetota bacterium]|nr:nucleoside-diphosphate sugar epimerase/dehydratase [Actinomycetota bacterium]